MRRLKLSLSFIAIFLGGYFLGQSSDLSQEVLAAETETAEVEYTIDNCVSVLDIDDVEKSSAGWFRWFIPRELTQGLVLKMSQVRPQQSSHSSHTHESQEMLYVLKGKAKFTIKEESKIVGENSSLYCPPGVPHSISNVGDEPLRYLVIHAY